MKLIIITCILLGIVSAGDEDATLLKSDQSINSDGSYQYSFETSNGIIAEEQGALKDEITIVAQGQYKYKSPEGEDVSVQYIADENGFQPQGSHIPTPFPIPELIARALEYAAAHPPKEE